VKIGIPIKPEYVSSRDALNPGLEIVEIAKVIQTKISAHDVVPIFILKFIHEARAKQGIEGNDFGKLSDLRPLVITLPSTPV